MACDKHDWQPISGWSARYRCSKCKAIGHKENVTVRYDGTKKPKRGLGVVEYRCQKKGCDAPAQVGDRHGKRRCFEHWNGA